MTEGVGLPFGRLAMTGGNCHGFPSGSLANDGGIDPPPPDGGLTAMDIGFQGSVSKNADLRFMLYIKNNLWGIR
jgi:hypothetical protein